MFETLGLFGYIFLLSIAAFFAIMWILMPIAVFGIKKRLDTIIELLSTGDRVKKVKK